MSKTVPEDRRPQHIAALGFLIQLVGFGVLLGVSVWAGSPAIQSVARLMGAGLPIWVVLYLIFKQLRRVRLEQLETEELKRARSASGDQGIFDIEDDALLIEQNRLRWMLRWFLPATTVILVAVLLGGHFIGWGWTLESVFNPITDGGISRARQPELVMFSSALVGLCFFLFSRYTVALSRLPNWRLLHAGATFAAGNALACLVLTIGLMATTSIDWAEPMVAFLVRWTMIIVGVELAVHFILDFYRPRTPGVVTRPSFDSRVFSLATEPGGIAKSIADAVNYQFGFEVSSTWFYQLLQRSLAPLMVVTCVIILGLTSLVIVGPDEQAVIERFGIPLQKGGAVLEPGLHVKLPYPIDVVHRSPVRRVRELVLGEATAPDEGDHHQAILWTEAHEYVPELTLMVAAPPTMQAKALEVTGSRSVAVSLLMVSVPIEYRVKDVERFLYRYDNPVQVLENIAYQQLSDHAGHVDMDTLMGPGRTRFNQEVRELIQQRADETDLGVEIVFVGLRGAHPPARDEVAAAFQNAISAQINKQATIHRAESEARRILTEVAGTEARARALDEAIRERDRLQTDPQASVDALGAARKKVKELLQGDPAKGVAALSGDAAAIIADARAAASETVSQAAAKVRGFTTEVAAYDSAPALYQQRKILEIYAELETVRKFLIWGDPANVIIEYNTTDQGGIDRVLTEGVESMRRK